jgi:hypothetical protein
VPEGEWTQPIQPATTASLNPTEQNQNVPKSSDQPNHNRKFSRSNVPNIPNPAQRTGIAGVPPATHGATTPEPIHPVTTTSLIPKGANANAPKPNTRMLSRSNQPNITFQRTNWDRGRPARHPRSNKQLHLTNLPPEHVFIPPSAFRLPPSAFLRLGTGLKNTINAHIF